MKGELELLIGGRRTMLCTKKFMPVPGVSHEPFKPLQDTAGHSTARPSTARHGRARGVQTKTVRVHSSTAGNGSAFQPAVTVLTAHHAR